MGSRGSGLPRKKYAAKALAGGAGFLARNAIGLKTNTPLKEVKSVFSKVFLENDFIEQRFAETGKPVVVLDWGCGNGLAVSQLAKEKGAKIAAYGFSADSYREWLDNKRAKFIHATAKDLFRYLKNDSLDLVYSHSGLDHLFPRILVGATPHSLKRGLLHIEDLLRKVSPGGKIVFDLHLVSLEREAVVSELAKILGKKAEVSAESNCVYITKNAQ